MPKALTRACRQLGCAHPEPCPVHGRPAAVKHQDQRRGTASARGYGAKWRYYREWWFARVWELQVSRAGLCGCRLPEAPVTADSVCAREQRPVFATVLDHIQPVTGPNDPVFYDPANHQGLCDACHQAKRARERKAVV